MEHRFILTAFGKDRPGIVAEVTRMLFDNGCNLEDSSMTRLAEEFTLMLLFSAPRADIQEPLAEHRRILDEEGGISVFIKPIGDRRREPAGEGLAEATLHVEGTDQAGIVYGISNYLARAGLNIVDLKSTVRPAPESGTTLYLMDIHFQIPAGTARGPIEKDLAAVADDLNVDITLSV